MNGREPLVRTARLRTICTGRLSAVEEKMPYLHFCAASNAAWDAGRILARRTATICELVCDRPSISRRHWSGQSGLIPPLADSEKFNAETPGTLVVRSAYPDASVHF